MAGLQETIAAAGQHVRDVVVARGSDVPSVAAAPEARTSERRRIGETAEVGDVDAEQERVGRDGDLRPALLVEQPPELAFAQ